MKVPQPSKEGHLTNDDPKVLTSNSESEIPHWLVCPSTLRPTVSGDVRTRTLEPSTQRGQSGESHPHGSAVKCEELCCWSQDVVTGRGHSQCEKTPQ